MFEALDLNFFIKLLINTSSIVILIFGCYMRRFAMGNVGNREHASSFLLFGVGVFTVTFLLHSVEISMGFAFGLFAVFSMLRYRTESISVKEMTYLFMVIAMSLLSAVGDTSLVELCVLHAVFLASAIVGESVLAKPALEIQEVQYEKIENIKPERRHDLIADLTLRTGLNVQEVEILHIDFLRDTANLKVLHLPLFVHEKKERSSHHETVKMR
jgi:hypothetical protein